MHCYTVLSDHVIFNCAVTLSLCYKMNIHGITFAAPGRQLYIRMSTEGHRKPIESGQPCLDNNSYI